MDQPALDQRLGTVGRVRRVAPEPQRIWSRIDHRYSRKRRRQAASTDIPQIKEGCPFRKSYPDVLVVQPGQDWDGDNDTEPLDRPTQGRILAQRQVRARLIVLRRI